ncbi:hypothetical protein DPMN_012302 [Dreissena polymorpha]|uniref:Uncharacterized protein n=1 Tax=Dreissena polymorpha TaxID=45954 RepID=A0A9D4S2L5_DREPO|nr:hypothetical protein DPMN_012302 [Dreissena polymorpha]
MRVRLSREASAVGGSMPDRVCRVCVLVGSWPARRGCACAGRRILHTRNCDKKLLPSTAN